MCPLSRAVDRQPIPAYGDLPGDQARDLVAGRHLVVVRTPVGEPGEIEGQRCGVPTSCR